MCHPRFDSVILVSGIPDIAFLMCPPGTDQTARSSQRWTLLAPLREQQLQLENIRGYGFHGPRKFCVSNDSFDAFTRLYKPSNNLQNLGLARLNKVLSKCKSPSARSSIEKLPSELMRMIHLLLGPADLVALGLCSQSLWMEAVSSINHIHRSWANERSWAGTPIILTGTYLTRLPQAIYDACPESEPDAPEEPVAPVRGILDMPRPRRWNWDAMSQYDTPLVFDYGLHRREFLPQMPLSGIPDSIDEDLEYCLDRPGLDGIDQWYLRNFNTKEYVRMELVRDLTMSKEATVSLVGNRWLTLDILLVWLISWSVGTHEKPYATPQGKPSKWVKEIFTNKLHLSDGGAEQCTMPFENILIGKWAGHSFDVVDQLTEEIKVGWTDKTDEIEALSQHWFAAMYADADDFDEEVGYRKYWDRFAEDQVNKAED